MRGYEVVTMGDMGDLSLPPAVKEAGETVWDLMTGGPERRWAAQKVQEAKDYAKTEIQSIEASVGKALSKWDPRVMALKAMAATEPDGVYQTIGKVAAVASAGVVGYAIFSYIKTVRTKR